MLHEITNKVRLILYLLNSDATYRSPAGLNLKNKNHHET